MADQKEITLRSGDATPKDIVLYELPVASLAASTTIYLVAGDATPKNVVLRDPTVQPGASGPATITGTLAATDAADSAAFTGDIAHTGSLAATDGADTFAASGEVIPGSITITGDLAATDGADTAAMAGAVAHVGTLAATDGADGFAAEGTVESQAIAGPIIYLDGGGAARRVKRRKERKNRPLWEDMAEVYDVLMDIGSAPEVAEVVAEYVEPAKPSLKTIETPAAVAIIPPPQIDWRALARDMETVYRLVALYEKARADQQDEEEAEMLLLM